MGSSGGKLFLYDTPEYKIPCSAAPNLRQIDSGCTGTVVLRHYDALPSGGIAPQICTAYRICIFIRGVGAFVPALDNPDQVSDRARSIQAVSVWMGSHCGGVRNPFGGGRNHQQRPGDLCDADIRCHGAASGLQGCRTGGNAGQRRKHIRRRFPGEIPGKTPQSSIDIKKGFTYNKARKNVLFQWIYTNSATKREYMAQRCYDSLFQYQGGFLCQYLILATHPKRKKSHSALTRYIAPMSRRLLRRSPCLFWITAAGPGNTITETLHFKINDNE